MAVEFIGSLVPAGPAGQAGPARGQDADFPVQAAELDAEAGFDKLLIGYGASAPDGMLVADEVLTTTSRLGAVIAQVPGLVAPTVAARQYATLAAFHQGRVAMHALTDIDAAGTPRTSDATDRYRQAGEFLEIVQRSWRAPGPFDFRGEFYRVNGADAPVYAAGRGVPVYCSGESADALRIGAAHADVYLLAAAPATVIARGMAELRALAAGHGRSPRIGVSMRLTAVPARRAALDLRGGQPSGHHQPSWIPPANLAPAAGGQVRAVGGYDQVATVLLEYAAIGVSTFVLGHDPITDADACAEVIALVRADDPGRSAA